MTLTEHQLSTDLHVENTSALDHAKSMEFQALFHNYIAAPASEVTVVGLKGLQYTDKTDSTSPRKLETRDNVDVLDYTDYVYEDGPREYLVKWGNQGIKVKAIGLKDVVVWNPSTEAGKKLGDMEEGGWLVVSDVSVTTHSDKKLGKNIFVSNLDTSSAGQVWILVRLGSEDKV